MKFKDLPEGTRFTFLDGFGNHWWKPEELYIKRGIAASPVLPATREWYTYGTEEVKILGRRRHRGRKKTRLLRLSSSGTQR